MVLIVTLGQQCSIMSGHMRFTLIMEMSRLTRDGTAEPVSRDQILRHARGQGNIHFPCSADHEQDWQPYPVDPYSAICDDHTYIHTYDIFLWHSSSSNDHHKAPQGHLCPGYWRLRRQSMHLPVLL